MMVIRNLAIIKIRGVIDSMNNIRDFLIVWLILGLSATSCASQNKPIPTIELQITAALPLPTSIPPSATDKPSVTLKPTDAVNTIATHNPGTKTPTPIPTPLLLYPTADSSVPLTSNGPWLAYLSDTEDGNTKLSVVNSNGSGRKDINSDIWAIVGSPSSPYLAGLTQQDDQGYADGKDTLEILHLPDLSLKIIPLISSPKIETYDYSLPYSKRTKQDGIELITTAIRNNLPSWSPNGRYLAFTAAIDGPTTDLYIYDTISDVTRRLTDGPDMATKPEWSPDSKWIVHRGFYTIGEGCSETGVWAAAVDGSEVKWLYPRECFKITRWIGPETFETYTDQQGGAYITGFVGSTQRVDIPSGATALLSPSGMLDPSEMTSFDCLTQKKIEKTSFLDYDSIRSDSPDGKWFVVIHDGYRLHVSDGKEDGLRLYGSDGKPVTEFYSSGSFLDWQPDSKAMVFLTPGKLSDRGTINYFQLENQKLITYTEVLPASYKFSQFIWGSQPLSLFLRMERTQELLYIDLGANQISMVDWPTGRSWEMNYAWIGMPNIKSESSEWSCIMTQP